MKMVVNMKAVANEAARKLIRLALDNGSVDDITVLVHLYDWGPKLASTML
jgi:serine/threonine protein phosphatase PrpC